ncbi:RNA polymerase sigma factor [Aquitalea aquatica]|uniref:RNA polymerase sigma factor n=1 Tax=Aquitalea aquatica TaxID=3044273 RepID=UPI001C6A7DFE|nr:RNA polymerase sigma factor [Aquitalea magnusonii]
MMSGFASLAIAMPISADIASLYLNHIVELRRYLTGKVGSPALADDLAHETFVRVLATDKALDDVRQPRALLFCIARHLLIDHYRGKAAHAGWMVPLESCQQQVSATPSPERIVLARQQLAQLRHAIDSLPPRCRQAFVRFRFDGIPQKTLAAELGITLNAVEKLLIRAMLALRQQLEWV